MKKPLMTLALAAAALTSLLTTPLAMAHGEPHADVKPVITKVFNDIPGKEGLVITVSYPPGAADPIHRHDAHAFIYVLEGTIEMQVKGGEKVTLKPGGSFYEAPDDVHLVGRNASKTKPAKFIVFLVKNVGAEVVLPVK